MFISHGIVARVQTMNESLELLRKMCFLRPTPNYLPPKISQVEKIKEGTEY